MWQALLVLQGIKNLGANVSIVRTPTHLVKLLASDTHSGSRSHASLLSQRKNFLAHHQLSQDKMVKRFFTSGDCRQLLLSYSELSPISLLSPCLVEMQGL